MNITALAKGAIASSLGWPLTCRWIRPSGVTVLMYHRITLPDCTFNGCPIGLFREQMRWLKQHCLPIGPDDVLLQASRPRNGPPPVLVTFDDGYRDYFDNAYPVLKELDIPAVVFLATAFMDEGGMIWTDETVLAVEKTTAPTARLPWLGNGSAFDLSRQEERNRFRDMTKLHLKGVPDGERKAKLAQVLDVLKIHAVADSIDRQMLAWDEVRASMDLTTYGGHSHTHPIMSQLDELSMEKEIETCRKRILEETGQAPKYFAYPNGRQQDFNDLTKRLLRKHGFELAFCTVPGSYDSSMDRMAIRRVHNGNCVADMACLIAGISRA